MQRDSYCQAFSAPASSTSSQSRKNQPPITQEQSLSPAETDTLYPGKGIFTYQGEGIRGNIEQQVRDANEKLQEGGSTHHERFVTTSWNNMAQYTEKATSLIEEKYQELQVTMGPLHKSLSTSLHSRIKTSEPMSHDT